MTVSGTRENSKYNENWTDSGNSSKVEPTEFLDGLDMGTKKEGLGPK